MRQPPRAELFSAAALRPAADKADVDARNDTATCLLAPGPPPPRGIYDKAENGNGPENMDRMDP